MVGRQEENIEWERWGWEEERERKIVDGGEGGRGRTWLPAGLMTWREKCYSAPPLQTTAALSSGAVLSRAVSKEGHVPSQCTGTRIGCGDGDSPTCESGERRGRCLGGPAAG